MTYLNPKKLKRNSNKVMKVHVIVQLISLF